MSAEIPKQTNSEKEEMDNDLPLPWKRIQGALWLIGLAILAWKGWWWPGILVLVALSGLFQAGVQVYLQQRQEKRNKQDQWEGLNAQRASWLPAVCPRCGAPLGVDIVEWSSASQGKCPYCKALIRPEHQA